MSLMNQYYVWLNGVKEGPFDAAKIYEMHRAGSISDDTLVQQFLEPNPRSFREMFESKITVLPNSWPHLILQWGGCGVSAYCSWQYFIPLIVKPLPQDVKVFLAASRLGLVVMLILWLLPVWLCQWGYARLFGSKRRSGG